MKVLAVKPEYLSLIPRSHMVEGKNLLCSLNAKQVPWHTHKHTEKNDILKVFFNCRRLGRDSAGGELA